MIFIRRFRLTLKLRALKLLFGHLGRDEPSSKSALGHLGYGVRSKLGWPSWVGNIIK